MKALSALLSVSLFCAAAVYAQEAPPDQSQASPPPSSDAAAPAPGTATMPAAQNQPVQLAPPPSAPEDLNAPETPVLIPQTETTFVKPAQSWRTKIEKKTKTEQAEDDLLQRVRFREALTKVLPDPKVQEAWHAVLLSHTDYEQRESVKRYYKLLYDKVEKLDNRFPLLVAEARKTVLTRETQSKLVPSEPPAYLKTATAER